MTDLNKLKNFLRRIGLQESEISTLRADEGKLCKNCKNRSTRHWAIFKPCGHYVCFSCLDDLYDNYILTDTVTMFVCPFCDVKVVDYDTVTSS